MVTLGVVGQVRLLDHCDEDFGCALGPAERTLPGMTDTQQPGDLMSLLPYVLEIDRQCQLALAAADQMAVCAERFWPVADSPSVIGDFFDLAQHFSCSVGILDKILYARGKRPRMQRSEHLRSVLGLPGDSPLTNWAVRNDFEHIDERIDEWVKQNPGAISYSRGGISRTGEAPLEPVTRHYDSATDDLSVWGARVKLEPAVHAVRDLHGRILDFWRTHQADPVEAVVDEEPAPDPSEEVDLERLGITITSITSVVALRDEI